MKKTQYKIVIDTNIVYPSKDADMGCVFNEGLEDLSGFIKTDKKMVGVSIVVPELVKEERLAQIKNKIDNHKKALLEAQKNLASVKINVRIPKIEQDRIKRRLDRETKIFLKKHKIRILEFPKIDAGVIQRALDKKAPFADSKDQGDKGFKDTLIWLSVLEDAQKEKNTTYILCSSDTAFSSENMKEEMQNTGNHLEFLKNISEVKGFLDKKLNLKRKLKETYRRVEQGVKNNIGDIIVKINQEEVTDIDKWNPFSTRLGMISSLALYGSDEEVLAYKPSKNYELVTFKNIKRLKQNKYEVSLEISLEPILIKKPAEYELSVLSIGRTRQAHFIVSAEYDLKNEKIKTLSITKDYRPYQDSIGLSGEYLKN